MGKELELLRAVVPGVIVFGKFAGFPSFQFSCQSQTLLKAADARPYATQAKKILLTILAK